MPGMMGVLVPACTSQAGDCTAAMMLPTGGGLAVAGVSASAGNTHERMTAANAACMQRRDDMANSPKTPLDYAYDYTRRHQLRMQAPAHYP
jgi:hypothetical protein